MTFERGKKVKKIISLLTIAFAVVSIFVAIGDIASTTWKHDGFEVLAGPGERDGFYVILFRGSSYCPTCDIMERLTAKLINSPGSPFAKQVESGDIEFKIINYELPGNDHYLFDYDLYTTSIVLIDQRDGLVERWKNLHDSWEMAEDENSYNVYLTEEIQLFQRAG